MAKETKTQAPVDPVVNAASVEDLSRIAASATAHANRCFAHASNSTFGMRYEDLAKVCQTLIDLITERGHTGVPELKGDA